MIHAVGPVWDDQSADAIREMDNKLALAVTGSLVVADELNCTSVALPAVSTGIFGFPKDRAAAILLFAIEKYFGLNSNSGIKIVKLVLYDQPTVDVFVQTWHAKWADKP